ncbi:DUF742 domain-containing protein [Luedemannella helvata]|uniref:DUF742 domain-containing protein n=1 Tax=Luedemannella helvata TaxID=349315 RepID=A0ABP4WKR0_9ACTN
MADTDEPSWLDQDAGPVVRAFAVTRGRARPIAGSFDLMAHVVAVNPGSARPAHLQPEHHAILALVMEPASVAKIASELDLALGVIRVLLGDLMQEGLIAMYDPPGGAEALADDVLQAVLHGLRDL